MENFSEITIRIKKQELEKARRSVRKSLNMLADRTSDYAEHHQHVINTLSEMIEAADNGMKESASIGTGV